MSGVVKWTTGGAEAQWFARFGFTHGDRSAGGSPNPAEVQIRRLQT